MAKGKLHVGNKKVASKLKNKNFDSESEGSVSDSDEELQNRLQGSDSEEDQSSDENEKTAEPNQEQSGMASVMARILSKDVSKSNRVLLAKGKTNKEVLQDILERKRIREETDQPPSKVKKKSTEAKSEETSDQYRDEKKKIWEAMARKLPSVLDLPKETRLRKIATQGMVQLFRSVNEHQKVINQKLASVGSSERKRDQVMSEFTKGKFLDLLKGGTKEARKSEKTEDSGKWKILKDDFMMGAQMKDWDKEDDEEDVAGSEEMMNEDEEMMDADSDDGDDES